MRIAHLTNFYPLTYVHPPIFSGSERYVFDMSERLAKRDHKVLVVYKPVVYKPENKKLKLDAPKKVKFVYVPDKVYFPKVLKAIRKFKPDIIHAHNFKMGALAALIGIILKKPVVCSILLSENEAKGFLRKSATFLLQPVFKGINFIAISDDIANSIRQDIGAGAKIDVIYCWTWNHDLIKKAASINFRGKFPNNAKITFTISRIEEEKGITYLIDAASEVLKKRSDVYFVISGGGPQLEEYRNLVKKMGIENNVILTGRITDMELLDSYKGCDMIIYPSPMDYLFSVSESLVTGKPVVATKVKSAMEIYKDMENAFLVDPKNSHQIAQAVLEILNNERLKEKIIKNAKITGKSLHPDVAVKKVENLYKRILANK